MSRYTVQITFKAPGLRAPLERRVGSVRLYGSGGTLAATGVAHGETPSEAAQTLAREAGRDFPKGSLQLVAWTARRERVRAFGARRTTTTSGRNLMWDDETDPGDEGGAGVREPRRPLPGPGSMSATVD